MSATVFMLWLAATHPVWFAIVLVVSIVAAVLVMLVLVQFLRTVLRGLKRFLSGQGLPQGTP